MDSEKLDLEASGSREGKKGADGFQFWAWSGGSEFQEAKDLPLEVSNKSDLKTEVSSHQKPPSFGGYRYEFEAEVNRVKSKYGSLDEMRSLLGLSRRQVCRVLLVDPSAWSRWTKSDAPPHVYASLENLIKLFEKGDAGSNIQLKTLFKSEINASRGEILALRNSIKGVLKSPGKMEAQPGWIKLVLGISLAAHVLTWVFILLK